MPPEEAECFISLIAQHASLAIPYIITALPMNSPPAVSLAASFIVRPPATLGKIATSAAISAIIDLMHSRR